MRYLAIAALLLSGCAARQTIQVPAHVETFSQEVPAAGVVVFRFHKPFVHPVCVSNEKAQGLEWTTDHVRAHLAQPGEQVTVTCRETTP
jgi:hypothetical protein